MRDAEGLFLLFIYLIIYLLRKTRLRLVTLCFGTFYNVYKMKCKIKTNRR